MAWEVRFSKKAVKQYPKLPQGVQDAVALLMIEIRKVGPVRGNWPNYGKLPGFRHHCHLKKGKPTYVAVWREDVAGVHLIEVTYVGTHEKAPY